MTDAVKILRKGFDGVAGESKTHKVNCFFTELKLGWVENYAIFGTTFKKIDGAPPVSSKVILIIIE